jgi:hypothetical protein
MLDGHDVVRQELFADDDGVRADGVQGVEGDDVPGQAVTSSIEVCPHSTAAVHSASTDASECRIPRASRGSGTDAKHSSRFPPDAASRLAAWAASSARASSAAAGAGM